MSDINKILIIEDNAEVVEAVSLVLEIRWPKADIISADKGGEGIDITSKDSPDVIILDLGLPDMSGFDVLKKIRSFSKVPVVILTVREEEKDIVKGLELGADQYIVKPFRQLELVSRINTACKRNLPSELDSSITCGNLTLYPHENIVERNGGKINLTHTECAILTKLMENADHTLPYSRLMGDIWENEKYVNAPSVVKVHINRLRKKLEMDPNHPTLIITKHGLGYSLAKSV